MLLKTLYDASYSVVQGVGARRVGDVRRVGRCRGPTRRKIPISTVVEKHETKTSPPSVPSPGPGSGSSCVTRHSSLGGGGGGGGLLCPPLVWPPQPPPDDLHVLPVVLISSQPTHT